VIVWILPLLGISGIALPPPRALASTFPGIRSLSPVPGSRLLRPETNLIVKLERPLGAAGRRLESAITVSGDRSGRHEGRVIVANDDRTVLFQPTRAFADGEEVRVDLRPPLTAATDGVGFSFFVSPHRAVVTPAMEEEWVSDLVPSGSPPAIGPGATIADTLPGDFPEIEYTVFDSAAVAPGMLYLSNLSFGPPTTVYLLVLDRQGSPIFYRAMKGTCLDFKLQPNGLMTYLPSAMKKMFAMDATFTVVDSFSTGNGYETDPHEGRMLPNGHVLLMSYDPQPVDMSQVVPGGNPDATVIGLVIQEVDDQQNVYFQWRSWDHFEITDASHQDLTAASIDYVHGNAIEIDDDGNLLISSRHLDEITKIDRETGDVLWRWGGKRNQFAFIDDTLGFNYQHAIRRIANGHYTLWDNGNWHEPRFSRALEYRLDQEAKTAELVWQHREDPDVYSVAMGYVQRLDNGNTLIAMGAGKPDIFEVAPDGHKVMQLRLPPGIYSYRAYRAPLPAVPPPPQSRSLQLLSGAAPNPFRDHATVTVHLTNPTEVTLVLYDLSGREVRRFLDRTPVPAGSQSVPIDLRSRRGGLYFLKVIADGRSETRKLLLIH
jgi:hypothetical protein